MTRYEPQMDADERGVGFVRKMKIYTRVALAMRSRVYLTPLIFPKNSYFDNNIGNPGIKAH